MPGNKFAAGLERSFGGMFYPCAAGNFHAHDGNAFYVILPDDFGQLFCIIHAVELGAADERDAVFDESVMKIAVCISGAVSRDQQIRLVEIGSAYRSQFDLDRPLGQLAFV